MWRGVLAVSGMLMLGATPAWAIDFSTGGVDTYSTCGGGPDLSYQVSAARKVDNWYTSAQLPMITHWENDNVFNTDFTDGPGKDMDPGGGSDIANIYFFGGHGTCQNPPVATDPDFLDTCSHGSLAFTNIGASSRWGNAGGRLKFLFLSASCPMDLVSIANNWFPPFGGMHVAVGHSGNVQHDTLDSDSRPENFVQHTTGYTTTFLGITISTTPSEAVTWAWMDAGLIDVQSGVCAVSVANDSTRNAAINRRDSEKIAPAMGTPSGNWFAWRWNCA